MSTQKHRQSRLFSMRPEPSKTRCVANNAITIEAHMFGKNDLRILSVPSSQKSIVILTILVSYRQSTMMQRTETPRKPQYCWTTYLCAMIYLKACTSVTTSSPRKPGVRTGFLWPNKDGAMPHRRLTVRDQSRRYKGTPRPATEPIQASLGDFSSRFFSIRMPHSHTPGFISRAVVFG